MLKYNYRKLHNLGVIAISVAIFTLFLLKPIQAIALESDWHVTDQARVRLIVGETNSALLGVHFALEPGWKIYWRTPGDAGSALQINWQDSSNITNGEILWPAPKRHVDQFGENFIIQSFAYENEVVLPVKATITDPSQPAHINLKLQYSICKDICIPGESGFTLDVPPGYAPSQENITLINRYVSKVPTTALDSLRITPDVKLLQTPESKYFLEVVADAKDGGLDKEGVDLFVEGAANIRFMKPVIHCSNQSCNSASLFIPVDFIIPDAPLVGEKLRLTLVKGESAIEQEITAPAPINGVLPAAPAITSTPQKTATETASLALMFLYALLGGLVLNVMPCVLPVLSLKILGVIKHGGKHDADARFGLLATAAGIIISFLVLALVTIGLQGAGKAVGWGIQFQQPGFIIALILILIFFALNLLGRFHINLPVWLGGAVSHASSRHSGTLAGHFLTGSLATVLATPCTAPFVGVAISFALSQAATEILLIFTGLGIGMASPFLVIALFPRMVTLLPKPGAWMVTVKHILAVLLLITALWLLWVLSMQVGLVPAILTGLCCLMLKFWLAQYKGVLARPAVRWPLVLITSAVTFILPLTLMHEQEEQEARSGGVWQTFDAQAIPQLVAEGRVVFVDVTADWCTTCKVNKFFVLHQDAVLDYFSEHKVVAMRADITTPNAAVSAYLQSFNQYGIPFNVVYGPKAPQGIPLPTLLTTNRVIEGLKEVQ